MKISLLINTLQVVLNERGDLDVVLEESEYGFKYSVRSLIVMDRPPDSDQWTDKVVLLEAD